MRTYHATVVIGRFQLPHRPHIELIRKAAELGDQVVVLIGSSYRSRNIKNPFTWEERAQMLQLCLNEDERLRVQFLPIRDYGDNESWFAAAQRRVRDVVGHHLRDADIKLVGFQKDASSFYLKQLPWDLIDAGSSMTVDSTNLRKMLFEATRIDPVLALMGNYTHQSVLDFIRAWTALPCYRHLCDEHAKIQREVEKYGDSYSVAGDLILKVNVKNDDSYVLLVQRGRHPGKGNYAIPGGMYDPTKNETLFQTALREFWEETQHTIYEPQLREAFKGQRWFDAPSRSVRRNTMTMMHFFEMNVPELPEVKSSADPGEATSVFVKVSALPEMEDQFFDDHFMGLHHFLQFPIED